MFRSLRHKIVFGFLAIILLNLLATVIGVRYYSKREEITDVLRQIDEVHTTLLLDFKTLMDFISYESINPQFYETQKSDFLLKHRNYRSVINMELNQLSKNPIVEELGLQNQFEHVLAHFDTFHSCSNKIVSLMLTRGFKDYGTVGEMRDQVHSLEEMHGIDRADVLSLRRHEKDYIIRNQAQYIEKLNSLVDSITEKTNKQNIRSSQKQEIISVLDSYVQYFNLLVKIDQRLGVKNNTGAKLELDHARFRIMDILNDVITTSNAKKEEIFFSLKRNYAIMYILAISISLFLSYFFSVRITKPLELLTKNIKAFISNNFEPVSDKKLIITNDEIGALIYSFKILKKQIGNKINYFQQEVNERTTALANANKKLKHISSINEKFVPKKLLKHLGHESIVDIKLGDYASKEMTVLSISIKDFDGITVDMEIEDKLNYINTFIRYAEPVINKQKGFIEQYNSSKITSFFPKNPTNALYAAHDMLKMSERFNLKMEFEEKPMIELGMGIDTGKIIFGTIGEEKRMNTTIMSEITTRASHFEKITKSYGVNVIVSKKILEEVDHHTDFSFRSLSKVQLGKGSEPRWIYEVLFEERVEDQIKIKDVPKFEKAMDLYRNKNFSEAYKLFTILLENSPNDHTVIRFKERCNILLSAAELTGDWEQVDKLYLEK